MRIATLGRGTIGGTLARLWTAAGHEVSELGRGGGDVSGADVVLLAVPSAAVTEYVKAQTGGPVAKAFNLNFGKLFDQAATTSNRPNNIWVGDEGARAAVEQLSRDIGMEPLNAGPLEDAATQEAFAKLLMGIVRDAGDGLLFYRFAAPDKL
jgi:predicted dinucleotide-binding enzyme